MREAVEVRRAMQLLAIGLLVAAVAQEAATPGADRTWRGRVLGIVPYDFNPPTWERIRRAHWNPDDERLFTHRVLGVGWAINLHRAGALLSGLFRRLVQGGDQPVRLRHPRRD